MRMTRPSPRGAAGRAADRDVRVVAAVLVTGSEKEAAHRLGLSHSTVKHHLANARSGVGATTTAQFVWVLAPRLPVPSRHDDLRICAADLPCCPGVPTPHHLFDELEMSSANGR